MYLIQSSRDLLNIVLAFCVLWLTIFIVWFIYYLIMMIKEAYKITKEMHERINKVDHLIDTIRERFEHGSAYLLLITEGIKKLVDIAKKYNKKSKK